MPKKQTDKSLLIENCRLQWEVFRLADELRGCRREIKDLKTSERSLKQLVIDMSSELE